MIVTTAQLYKVAYKKFAVGAYNINNLEQTMGLFRGCMQSKAPFIIQLSKGARGYTDKSMLEAIIRTAEKIFPEAIFAVHLDQRAFELAPVRDRVEKSPGFQAVAGDHRLRGVVRHHGIGPRSYAT